MTGSQFSVMGSRSTPGTVITDARSGNSKEMATRQKRYAITMGFRTLCFISMIFVPGNFRWVLLAGAVFLPYVAVVFANQVDTKTPVATDIPQGEPTAAPQLTRGEVVETVEGEVLDDEPTAAPGPAAAAADEYERRDRVA